MIPNQNVLLVLIPSAQRSKTLKVLNYVKLLKMMKYVKIKKIMSDLHSPDGEC